MVHLTRGGKPVTMSKRSGTLITLREVLEEVGRDACRFFFSMRSPNSQLQFDLELAKKQSQENPVYYVQYVHARICSIFREAEKKFPGLSQNAAAPTPPKNLQTEERQALLQLIWLPETLSLCFRELSPHPLTNYLLELSKTFHAFYENCRVLTDDLPSAQSRLAICTGIRLVIQKGLDLLGVSAPEKM